jgi:HK97 family phage major capsid protein
MFHDSVLKEVKSLTDSQGRLLWVPGIAAGEPDTILGYPYTINQSMSTHSSVSTGSTDGLIVAFGDFNTYVIRDVQDVTLIRLNERYADQGAIGFFTLSRHGGGLLNAGTDPIVGLYANST